MSWELIAGILGAIVLIGNAGAMIYKWLRPAMAVKKDVEEMKRGMDELRQHDSNDLEALKRLESLQRAQCRAMIDLINHTLDGNGVDKMRKTREEIQDLLMKI